MGTDAAADISRSSGAAELQTQLDGESIMKRTTKIAVAVGAALSLGLAAAVVSAHPTGMGWGGDWGGGPGYGMHGYGMGYGMGPGYGMHGYGMGYGMGPRGMFYGDAGDAEQGLAGLKSELGISAKQESAWQAFIDNAKQQEKNREAWFAKLRQARSAGTTPDRLAQQAEFMKQRQSDLANNAAALKDLYAALTPEQQAIADQRLGGFGPGYGYRGGPRARSR